MSKWDGLDTETGQVLGLSITIDSRLIGHVHLSIHELLHVYFAEQRITFSYEVEEVMIVALAKNLAQYLEIPKHQHLLIAWDKAIKRKLA